MKKLLLIDDNKENNRERYGASFVDEEEFCDVLQHIEKLNETSDWNFLDDAACVMLHDTLDDFIDGKFHSDSHVAKESIKDIMSKKEIPTVYFSDGHSVTIYDATIGQTISSINKKTFYQNLKKFVVKYSETGNVDLGLLAFGEMYIVDEMSLCADKLFKSISGQAVNERIAYNKLDENAVEFLIKATQPAIGINDADTFYEVLEDSGITAGEFRDKINEIIDSFLNYGENIHSWQ